MLPQGHFERNNGDRSGIRTLDLLIKSNYTYTFK